MRVTDLTKHDSVIRNVNNNSERMQTLQENMASGKRINTLSDDPIGATQVQDFRTRLSYFNMVKRNIQTNYILLDRYEAELSHIGDLLGETKNLVLAQANSSADEATRAVTAAELQATIDALYDAGNAKVGKLFIFAGTQTLTQPLVQNEAVQPAFVFTRDIDSGTFTPLEADRFNGEFIGHSKNIYLVRISKGGPLGLANYQVSDDSGETWSREKTLLRDNPVFNEDGKPDDRVMLKFHTPENADPLNPLIFTEGLEFGFTPNPKISYVGNSDIKMVPTGEGATAPINLTAEQVFFQHEGDPDSIDTFGLLNTIHRALVENEPQVLEERLEGLDKAFNQVLNRRADIGAIRKELELQFDKMGEREFTKTKQLADVEDLDFQEAVVEMNLAELRNKASLDTGGRLLQPSLLNFLR